MHEGHGQGENIRGTVVQKESKKRKRTKGQDLQEEGLGPIVIDRRHSGHEKVCRRAYLQEGQNGRRRLPQTTTQRCRECLWGTSVQVQG